MAEEKKEDERCYVHINLPKIREMAMPRCLKSDGYDTKCPFYDPKAEDDEKTREDSDKGLRKGVW